MTRDQQRLAGDLMHIAEAIEHIDRHTADMDEVAFLEQQGRTPPRLCGCASYAAAVVCLPNAQRPCALGFQGGL